MCAIVHTPRAAEHYSVTVLSWYGHLVFGLVCVRSQAANSLIEISRSSSGVIAPPPVATLGSLRESREVS